MVIVLDKLPVLRREDGMSTRISLITQWAAAFREQASQKAIGARAAKGLPLRFFIEGHASVSGRKPMHHSSHGTPALQLDETCKTAANLHCLLPPPPLGGRSSHVSLSHTAQVSYLLMLFEPTLRATLPTSSQVYR
jgi:hypothetical protein